MSYKNPKDIIKQRKVSISFQCGSHTVLQSQCGVLPVSKVTMIVILSLCYCERLPLSLPHWYFIER